MIFSNGGHYRYTGETAERHYQALMAAHADEKQSVGTYFARNVRHDKALKTAKVERK